MHTTMHTDAQKCGMAASLSNSSPSVSPRHVEKRAVSFLPAEIWIQVFESLCVHCHADHARGIPDFRIADARAGKATLMALCLVSREVRAMSQEILFHYFLNHSQGGELGEDGFNGDRTPSFLRALVSNPPLGRLVRMMGIFWQPYQSSLTCKPDIKRQDLESWARVSATYDIRVPSEVTRALDGHVPDEASRLFLDEPGPMAQLQLSSGVHSVYVASMKMEEVFKWVHLLTLNFVPHVTHLQLSEPFGSLEELQKTPPTFSKLRELTYDAYLTLDLIEFQPFSPNLRSLGGRNYAVCVDHPRQMNCPIPAMGLRKLSINGGPRTISLLLWLCPYLEDLECHVDPWGWDGNQYDGVAWPASAKNTLRRLAWSNNDHRQNLDQNPGFISSCTVPLREFERLEVLEIDQLSLLVYSKSLGAKTLSSVLPKSLRVLHTAFSRDTLSQLQIARQLREIASARAMELPNLSIVKVGEPPRWGAERKKLGHFLQRTGIMGVMRDAGIELRVGKEAPKNAEDRSILSQPPGAARKNGGPTLHDEVFSLNDI